MGSQNICPSDAGGTTVYAPSSCRIHRDRKQRVVARDRGGAENEQLAFNGCRVSVWEDAQIWEMDGGPGCTTM